MNSNNQNKEICSGFDNEDDDVSEINVDEQLDNEKPCKSTKIQNGIHENYKVNNNIDIDDDEDNKIPIKTNGSSSRKDDNLTMTNINILKNNSSSSSCSFDNTNDQHDDAEIRNNVDYICDINKCPPKVSCSTSPDADCTWSNKINLSSDTILNNIGGSIGSTSQGTCCFLRPNINGNKDGAGPSGLQRREQNQRRDSSSGNEGDMSDGEDYCIYTYKGNDQAPPEERINHANLREQEAAAAGQPLSGRSSPDMDFLEMDFDPGPSCEQDTGDSDLASINEDIQNIALDNVESDPIFLNDLSSGRVVSRQSTTPTSPIPRQNDINVCIDIDNHINKDTQESNEYYNQSSILQCQPSTSSGIRKPGNFNYQRKIDLPLSESLCFHKTSGDLISPGENHDTDLEIWNDINTPPLPDNKTLLNSCNIKINLSSTLYHRMMAKKLMLNKQTAFNQSGDSNLDNDICNERVDDLEPIEKIMIWTEQEAIIKQVTQIGTSACGATSAINALLALDVPFSFEVLVKSVATRLRERGSPLPRYLMSRSQAGATHNDIIRGLTLASNGAVVSRFFSFYPERDISLTHWLHYWISKGAVPIATLNLQKCEKDNKIPDAWHHQMIFGVNSNGIYFANPLGCVPVQYVWHQLTSPSVLLIRRADVLAHWDSTTDLIPLTQFDYRWRKFNVLGQVVNMIREANDQRRQPESRVTGPSHIRIPASYKSGITLVIKTDSPAADELLQTDELPLLPYQ